MKKLVVLGGGESGVGTAILAKEKGYQRAENFFKLNNIK